MLSDRIDGVVGEDSSSLWFRIGNCFLVGVVLALVGPAFAERCVLEGSVGSTTTKGMFFPQELPSMRVSGAIDELLLAGFLTNATIWAALCLGLVTLAARLFGPGTRRVQLWIALGCGVIIVVLLPLLFDAIVVHDLGGPETDWCPLGPEFELVRLPSANK